MRLTPRTLTALAASSILALGAVAASGSASAGSSTLKSNEALGLADDGVTLRTFELNDPKDDDKVGVVSGLIGSDTKLVGIDYRVQDKKFYGVGNTGGIYTIDTKNAQVTKVSQLTTALSGTRFGVDFNPAADRLRIISDNGQNLRHNVNPAGTTLTDTPLNYVVATPVAGITAAAYTNNDLVASTGTSIFDVDANLDQVVLQAPPNEGRVAATGVVGFAISPIVGFDIQSKLKNGATTSNTAYASLRSSDTSEPNLYKVDLLSGIASKVGDFDKQIADIAVKQP